MFRTHLSCTSQQEHAHARSKSHHSSFHGSESIRAQVLHMCARSVYMYIRMVRLSPALHRSYTIHYNVQSLITFQRTKETARSNVCVLHYTSVQHRLPHVQHRRRAIIKRPCSVTSSLHQPSKKNWQMRSLEE